VQRFGGFVAKYVGEGVLVYFGYPQAHEHDAERAVRAGLELIREVGSLKGSAPLQTRVGIATEVVVVGDLIGTGAAQEQTVVGETPNLAARLQGVAEPNTVVIAESTRNLLGNLFDLQDLGTQNLKGMDRPIRAWTALRPASAESRFEPLHASGSIGHRQKLLKALAARVSTAVGVSPSKSASESAEGRHLIDLLSELVAPSALSIRRHPQGLSETSPQPRRLPRQR
jgi:Adenylate and Guanylate cyclase catalytic domain